MRYQTHLGESVYLRYRGWPREEYEGTVKRGGMYSLL